jgi:hypothetical protein
MRNLRQQGKVDEHRRDYDGFNHDSVVVGLSYGWRRDVFSSDQHVEEPSALWAEELVGGFYLKSTISGLIGYGLH